ncbi:hypothetical protein KC338_g9359 [Hortaea werneckii]|nr:hypothetical protein KC338_g9359 [Hortaea werneckii]
MEPQEQPQKRRRWAYTHRERLALRRKRAAEPLFTQKGLCQWFNDQFAKPITQGTVSESLSKRYKHLDGLDDEELGTQRKKARFEKWPDLEAALAQWVVAEQERQHISGDNLRLRASLLWHQLPQYYGQKEPPWSNGWLAGFKDRKGLKEYRRFGEASSVDEEAVMQGLLAVQARIAQYSLNDQYNCDETGLFWKALPERSLATHRIAGLEKDEARISLHFCVNASGNHKLQPWIIGQYRNPRCFRAANIDIERMDCVYRSNSQSWMTGPIFEEWLRWFDRQMTGRKVVLLLDNFSAHLSAYNQLCSLPSEFGLQNTELVWLPPNSTSKTQPLDQGIIAAFKAIYKRHWLRYMMTEFEAEREPSRTINLLKAIRFILSAWHEVSDQTIANCWIRSQVNGSRQQQLAISQQKDTSREVEALQQELYQQARIKSLMDLSTLIEPADEAIYDKSEDLMDQIVEQYQPTPLEEPVDEYVEELPRVPASEALILLQRLRLHEEQSKDCNMDRIRDLERYERVLDRRLKDSLQQKTIDSWFQPP